MGGGGGGGCGLFFFFFFQAEDGIRDLVRSRGLGDVYKRQQYVWLPDFMALPRNPAFPVCGVIIPSDISLPSKPIPVFGSLPLFLPKVDLVTSSYFKTSLLSSPPCLLYTSDAADERSSVDLGGRRIIKKKKIKKKQKKHKKNKKKERDRETTDNTTYELQDSAVTVV